MEIERRHDRTDHFTLMHFHRDSGPFYCFFVNIVVQNSIILGSITLPVSMEMIRKLENTMAFEMLVQCEMHQPDRWEILHSTNDCLNVHKGTVQ